MYTLSGFQSFLFLSLFFFTISLPLFLSEDFHSTGSAHRKNKYKKQTLPCCLVLYALRRRGLMRIFFCFSFCYYVGSFKISKSFDLLISITYFRATNFIRYYGSICVVDCFGKISFKLCISNAFERFLLNYNINLEVYE